MLKLTDLEFSEALELDNRVYGGSSTDIDPKLVDIDLDLTNIDPNIEINELVFDFDPTDPVLFQGCMGVWIDDKWGGGLPTVEVATVGTLAAVA